MRWENNQKSTKRAWRRHHKQRMIRRAEMSFIVKSLNGTVRFDLARKWADHLKVCSCEYCCGNVRHNGWSSGKAKLTRQEHRHRLDYTEQLLELDEDESTIR